MAALGGAIRRHGRGFSPKRSSGSEGPVTIRVGDGAQNA